MIKLNSLILKKQLIIAILILFYLNTNALADSHRMSLEQRVICQTKIENTRWSHSVWPKENTQEKPQRSMIISDSQIRNKVERNMRMESALESLYGVIMDETKMQRELNRMARETRAPDRLQELFNILGNDPTVTAECLALPALVESLIQKKYESDPQLHAELFIKAQRAIGDKENPIMLVDSGAKEYFIEMIRKDQRPTDGKPLELSDGDFRKIELNSTEFELQLKKLSKSKSSTLFSPNQATESELIETSNAFIYTRTISLSNDRITIRKLVWEKQSFSSWWASQVRTWDISSGKLIENLNLPIIEKVRRNTQFTKGALYEGSWATPGLPAPRIFHTSVWTGSEMIIWGGNDLESSLSAIGWRYNPATDVWTPMNAQIDLDGRQQHSMIWTGTEIIVWGGISNIENRAVSSKIHNVSSNRGGRFNPVTSVWTLINTQDAPVGRQRHSAIWTGDEMIIWGGFDSGFLANGGRYNPASDSWLTISEINAPLQRVSHGAVWTGSEMLVWGGEGPMLGEFLGDGGRYNPLSDTWLSLAAAQSPEGRTAHQTTWSGNEMIIWGGFDGSSALNTGGRYDPISNSWSATSMDDAPSARWLHTAIWSGSELIVWGGESGFVGPPLNSGARYNPVMDSWQAVSMIAAPSGRTLHTAVWSGSEMIIWGTIGDHYRDDSGGRYDPENDSWTSMPTSGFIPHFREQHTAVWDGNEMIIWGGFSRSFSTGDDFSGLHNTGGRYDPISASWRTTSLTGAPNARALHTAIWSGTEMIVWGGTETIIGGNTVVNDGARYNTVSDSWMPMSNTMAPSPRRLHSVVWTGSEMMVWGGSSNTDSLNTGARYDLNSDSWTPISQTDGPTTRLLHGAVWTGEEMIIWGGVELIDNVVSADRDTGSRYNPLTDTWNTTNMSNAPSARWGHTSIWMEGEMMVWGGKDIAFNYLNTGSIYNPMSDSWSPISDFNAPIEKSRHTSVWTGDKVIVWGGEESSQVRFSNTGGLYSPATDSWQATVLDGAPAERELHTAVWSGNSMFVWGGRGFGSSSSTTPGIYMPASNTSIFNDGFESP